MEIKVVAEADSTILEVNGRVTMRNSHELLESLKNCLKAGSPHIFVHLAGVDYMDSSGIGVLITGMKLARKNDASIGLVALTTRVKQVMEMSGLGSVFSVFESLDDARREG